MTRKVFNSVLLILFSVAWLRGGDPSRETPETLVHAGHWKRARAILEPRVATNPQDAQTAYLLSQVKLTFGDFEDALNLAQRAVALDGNKPAYHFQLAVVYGRMAEQAGKLTAARLVRKFKQEIAAALALDPNDLDALEAEMIFRSRAPWLVGGNKAKARSIAAKILRLSPARGYLAEAELAQEEGNNTQLEAFYLKAVQADPRNYDAQTALASFYSRPPQNRYDRAAQYARNAIQLDPERIWGYTVLARVFALEHRWTELEAVLVAGAKRVPDDLGPYYQAANALLQSGQDLPRAEAYARKYLSQEPDGEEPDAADAHRLLGLVLEKQGRVSEAREEMASAVRIKPRLEAAREDLKRLGAQGN